MSTLSWILLHGGHAGTTAASGGGPDPWLIFGAVFLVGLGAIAIGFWQTDAFDRTDGESDE